MLDILRRIVQAVGTAASREEALSVIVRRVKQAMSLDVCSVYLMEDVTGEIALRATDGLNQEAVGSVRLPIGEGLVGLVGKRQEPVNLEDAPSHPGYRYFPETGEERYHGFLGVPIIHFGRVLGVLVAQQQKSRSFDQDETAFMVTIAAQLAGAIIHAAAGNEVGLISTDAPGKSPFVKGMRGAPGAAVGAIVLPRPLADLERVPDRKTEDPDAEEGRFLQAVKAVKEELRAGGKRLAKVLTDDAKALFDVHIMLLSGSELISGVVKRIQEGNWAPGALRDTITEHAALFEEMEDPYMRARAEDVRDIGRRILLYLQSAAVTPRRFPARCVLVGDELSVSEIAEVPAGQIAGIVCSRGSAMSHISVLAHALGIPAVMGLGDLPLVRLEGREIIVDGYNGRIWLEPTNAVLEEFKRLEQEEQELSAHLAELVDLPAETTDGVRVTMQINMGLLGDITPNQSCGAEGVGLYRTEYMFMVRHSFPGEEAQFKAYRSVLETHAPAPVTMRILDVGGDKPLPYLSINEDNPFLGWRGIRFVLDHPDIFLTQLRAMLRANAGTNNLRLLLPMISRVDEVDRTLGLLKQVLEELWEEGIPVKRPPIGVMVEVPSVVYQAAALAKRVDFISIGTNDLTQYLLAVDRNNARVAGLYDVLHPAVLGAVADVVESAQKLGKPVSVCGEMAGDPGAAILLMGMGVDTLSMSASSLPRAKWAIRRFSRKRATELLEVALEMESAEPIRAMLDVELDNTGLGGLVRAGKR